MAEGGAQAGLDPADSGLVESPHGVKRPLEEGQLQEGEQHEGPPFKRAAPGERAEAVMRLVVPARKVGPIRRLNHTALVEMQVQTSMQRRQ